MKQLPTHSAVLLVDGQAPPDGFGVALEQDMEGARAWWTRKSADYIVMGMSHVVKVRRLHAGARVTVGGRLVHVEGVTERLKAAKL